MLHSAIWLLLICVSLWDLDTLSHFIIPIPQREKQVRRGGRTCQDCTGVSSHSVGLTPKKQLCLVFVRIFGFSRAVVLGLSFAALQRTSTSRHKMACDLGAAAQCQSIIPKKKVAHK